MTRLKSLEISASASCRPSVTTARPPTKTSRMSDRPPENMNVSSTSSPDFSARSGAAPSSTIKSAELPTVIPEASLPIAPAPPWTANSKRFAPVEAGPGNRRRFRLLCIRRWPNSSRRSSSAPSTTTLLSEPIPIRPVAVINASAGNIPSPRSASVIGQSPATAPLSANARVSAAVICVACTKHQRPSTSAFCSNHSTGRAPLQAKHSSTSRVCSAI